MAAAVAAYLRRHPGFLKEHPELGSRSEAPKWFTLALSSVAVFKNTALAETVFADVASAAPHCLRTYFARAVPPTRIRSLPVRRLGFQLPVSASAEYEGTTFPVGYSRLRAHTDIAVLREARTVAALVLFRSSSVSSTAFTVREERRVLSVVARRMVSYAD